MPNSLTFTPVGKLSDTKYALALQVIFLLFIVVESSFLFYQFGIIVKNKSAKDVSLVAYIILAVANLMWILYAVFLAGDVPILISGILSMVGALLVVSGKLYYKDGKSNKDDDIAKNEVIYW